MVEVNKLFFNTPARRKFLKSNNTEISHIIDTIYGMALGNYHIQFRLFINKKLQKNFSLSDDLFQRSVRILGKDVADRLYKLEFEDSLLRIHGYCSNPSVTRSTSSKIFLFVNNRLVYDRGLISAIFQGYKGRIMKSKFPLGVFFIDIAPDQVDVNVHPSKREIKFFNGRQVYKAVSETIDRALSREQQHIAGYSKTQILSDGLKREAIEKFEYSDEAFKPGQMDKVEQSFMVWQKNSVQDRGLEQKTSSATQISPHESYKIIGHIMGTYILAEAGDALVLIDQHAAHERIVYENLKKRYHSLKVQTQDLAVPETLELNFKEADFLIDILDDLKAMGMIIEPFGDTTFVIKAVPAIIDDKEIKPIIIEIIETALVKKDSFSKEDWLEKCLILMACHGAIRANLNLAQTEIEKLLYDLEQCNNSRHCPHGRPIMITWTRNQIEKLFKRLV